MANESPHSSSTHTRILQVFVVGAFGGVAPTLLRFAVDLSKQNRPPLQELNASALLGLALFGLLGGAVAAIWKEVDLKKVFYIGLGLPSLLTVGTSTVTAPQQPVEAQLIPNSPAVIMNFQAVLFQSPAGGKIKIVLPPEVGYNGAVATFYRSDNSLVNVPLSAGADVAIPERSTAVAVVSPTAQSERVNVPQKAFESGMTVKFSAQKDPLYGLLYAVGAHSKPFKLIVSSVTSKKIEPRENTAMKFSSTPIPLGS